MSPPSVGRDAGAGLSPLRAPAPHRPAVAFSTTMKVVIVLE